MRLLRDLLINGNVVAATNLITLRKVGDFLRKKILNDNKKYIFKKKKKKVVI